MAEMSEPTTGRSHRRKVREGFVVSDVQDKTAIVETVDPVSYTHLTLPTILLV